MGVQSAATTRASRNRIGACTRGSASWADLAVRVDRGRNLFIPPLVGVASPGRTDERRVVRDWKQPPAKFNAERGFRGRCIGSREGVIWPRPVLGKFCTTSIKDSAIFLLTKKQKKNKIHHRKA